MKHMTRDDRISMECRREIMKMPKEERIAHFQEAFGHLSIGKYVELALQIGLTAADLGGTKIEEQPA